MNSYERLTAMMEGRPTDRLSVMPITMMFAAATAGVKYCQYARDYRILAGAQIQTAQRYRFDYVSAISDPGREAGDCGAALRWFDDQPPAMDEAQPCIKDPTDLARMQIPDPFGGGRMTDRVQGVAELHKRVGKKLFVEGWVEGPCAEAADLRGINALMLDFLEAPTFVQDLFAFCLEMAIKFARAQVNAGADIIGIGDAAASLVGPDIYHEFVWPIEKKLIDAVHAMGAKTRLHICGNTSALLAPIGELGSDIVDLDYPVNIAQARVAMGPHQILLGNLDPVRSVRNGTPETIHAALAECHRQAGDRYIIGAGCEIPRDTPPANVLAFADYVQSQRL
ncbi:MAG: uroporphyrinogen decarboxylase family protein [Phycisphaerales bacterium]|nr:uroporphyrinogen decarboxylase family protein [Phycisphaerales bacterium]